MFPKPDFLAKAIAVRYNHVDLWVFKARSESFHSVNRFGSITYRDINHDSDFYKECYVYENDNNDEDTLNALNKERAFHDRKT